MRCTSSYRGSARHGMRCASTEHEDQFFNDLGRELEGQYESTRVSVKICEATSKAHGIFRLRHCGPRPVPLLFLVALAAGVSPPALGHHSFGDAEDLGKTTDWERDGLTRVGNIPDVERQGENYFRFTVEVAGPIVAWTTGGLSPNLRIYDENRISLTYRDTPGARITEIEEPGDYFVVANSSNAGAYRLRLAGGGRGHDDIGNVASEARSVEPATSTLANPATSLRARIDYVEDRDYFEFIVPAGTSKWVRVWSSGGTDIDGILYDSYEVEIEGDNSSGAGRNFLIDTDLNPGVYYLEVRGDTGAYALHVTDGDDHGNLFQTASQAELHGETSGSVDYSYDRDVFWFQVTTPGSVEIQSSGSTNTRAVLYDSYEIELESGVSGSINRTLEPGIYYVAVHKSFRNTGPYTLRLSGEASGVVAVPLVPAHDHPRGQQGFVRIINHSAKEVEEVKVTAYDDTGRAAGSFTLENLSPWSAVHFNSEDLELGNRAKGINNGVGSGMGNWYLEVAPSEPEVEVLSYIRTRDGFLTSMHAEAPSYGREHRVAVFNPGSNRRQASRLRLIHPKCPQSGCNRANVTIFGVDDRGQRSPDVQFSLGSGGACDVTAAQLEGLDPSPMCLGSSLGDGNSLSDGTGKWQLFVSADQPIHVMSLLESATGHLTNLSAPTSRQVFGAPPANGRE